MADLVTMDQVRQQLRVDADTDALLIEGMVTAAVRAVELHTGRTVADGADAFGQEDTKVASQAVLMLVSTWYDNRDTSAPASSTELPLAVSWMLWPLKRLSV